jgi:hypothetical protein
VKWVLLGARHINTDQLQAFIWSAGSLYLTFNGETVLRLRDPDRELYLKLCRLLGVRPVEDDPDGEI